jgi:hypothetical protein
MLELFACGFKRYSKLGDTFRDPFSREKKPILFHDARASCICLQYCILLHLVRKQQTNLLNIFRKHDNKFSNGFWRCQLHRNVRGKQLSICDFLRHLCLRFLFLHHEHLLSDYYWNLLESSCTEANAQCGYDEDNYQQCEDEVFQLAQFNNVLAK